MKAVIILLIRSAIVAAVLYGWLFEGINGAGNVFAVYVALDAVLAIVFAVASFMPFKTLKDKTKENLVKNKPLGKFWRGVDATFYLVVLGVLIWLGHFFLLMEWLIIMVSTAVCLGNLRDWRKKAEAEFILKSSSQSELVEALRKHRTAKP
jgi:hypothetical protein